jgi:hypothetical protein
MIDQRTGFYYTLRAAMFRYFLGSFIEYKSYCKKILPVTN